MTGATAQRARPAPYPVTQTAACRGADPELFFPLGPTTTDHDPAAPAKGICRGCPIRQTCLEHALAWDVDGIWGGTTRRQRDKIRKGRGIAPLPILTPCTVSAQRRGGSR